MKAIWKFPLKTVEAQSVEMPLDAKILSVQSQFEEPMMWCLVEPDKPKAFREIRIIGTGHPVEDDFTGIYVGTYQVYGGSGVFHLFDYGYE